MKKHSVMKRHFIDNDPPDPDGIPNYQRLNMTRLDQGTLNDLLCACKERVIDDRLFDEEKRFLQEWVIRNSKFRGLYPVSVFYQRIREILLDGFTDNDEKTQLFSVLSEFKDLVPDPGRTRLSSSIPLDDPVPEVVIPDHNFCFAGVFAFGTQQRCEAETLIRKGRVKKEVNLQVDFLVVGELSNTDWIHSSYVRKIAKAIEVRELIKGLWIVSEESWASALERTAP